MSIRPATISPIPAALPGVTAETMPPPSPVIAQWLAAKASQPDALLFFRMGDFYELFFDDAATAATALGIALTARGEHDGKPIAMCGVPIHAAEGYLARLIRRGFRVAVCEQMESASARTGKAPLKREIVRLVTPGTLTEDALLDGIRPNLLLAIARLGRSTAAAWLDISTGQFETAAAPDLAALLGRLDPAEILAPPDLPLDDYEPRRAPETISPPPLAARARIAEAFGAATIEGFGSFTDAEAMAAATALAYVQSTQAGKMPNLSPPARHDPGDTLAMDAATRASLEITRARDGTAEHTLLAATQRTLTQPGGRLLAAWLSAPLTSATFIAARQDSWAQLLGEPAALAALRAVLRGVPDATRALGRISLDRGTPRDLLAIRLVLAAAAQAAALLPATKLLDQLRLRLTVQPGLQDRLATALAADLPARRSDGDVIAAGYDGELDAERQLRDDSRRVISGLQLDYAQRYRRRRPPDQTPRPARLRDRGTQQRRRSPARPAGPDFAPIHGQRRPLHQSRTRRSRPPHRRSRRARKPPRNPALRRPDRPHPRRSHRLARRRRRARHPRCPAILRPARRNRRLVPSHHHRGCRLHRHPPPVTRSSNARCPPTPGSNRTTAIYPPPGASCCSPGRTWPANPPSSGKTRS